MAKTVTLKVKVDPEAKEKAELIYSSLGMTLDEAVNVFLHKSVMDNGLPFNVQESGYAAAVGVPAGAVPQTVASAVAAPVAADPVPAAPVAADPATAAPAAPTAVDQGSMNAGGMAR